MREMTVYEMPQTSVDWIRNELNRRMDKDTAEKKWHEILTTYEKFASDAPDIGGNDNPIVRKLIHTVFGMRAKKLNKHKADGSWGNTWGMEINPLNHKEGISIHLVGCPIADFAKEHGYSELMPYFCETDKLVMEAFGGTLHREHTVADGYDDCDYWIKNKGE